MVTADINVSGTNKNTHNQLVDLKFTITFHKTKITNSVNVTKIGNKSLEYDKL